MTRFRKKPIEIEALQYDGQNYDEVLGWIDGGEARFTPATGDGSGALVIATLEGEMTVSPGDFVIKGVQGEFYPCKPDIFAATYDEISS